MKKLLAILLLLCLCIPGVLAEGHLELSETRLLRSVDGEYGDIRIYLQVTNTGDAPVALNEASVLLVNGNSELLEEVYTYSMYPAVLQPGKVGYMSLWYSDVADRVLSVTDYHVKFDEAHEYLPALQYLSCTYEYVELENENYTEYKLIFCVENVTDTVQWEPSIAMILRNENGKILDVQETGLYCVGIPANGMIMYEVYLSDYDLQRWADAGQPFSRLESYVYTTEYPVFTVVYE